MNDNNSLLEFIPPISTCGWEIFRYLTVRDVRIFSMVCKSWNRFIWCSNDDLWMYFSLRDLCLLKTVTARDAFIFVHLMESLGIVEVSTLYKVFKSYHVFHRDSIDIPSPNVNILNLIGYWRSVPQSFDQKHYRGGLMRFYLVFNDRYPRILCYNLLMFTK